MTEYNTKDQILKEFLIRRQEAIEKNVELTSSINNLSKKNTKTELLSGLREIEAKLANSSNIKKTMPVRSAAQKKSEGLSDNKAQPEKTKNITHQNDKAEKTYSEYKLLNQEVIDKIRALDDVKYLREQEYLRLSELEQELNELANMVNKGKETLSEKRQQNAIMLEEVKVSIEEKEQLLKSEINTKRMDLEQKLADIKSDIQEKKQKRDLDRKQEVERYEYELAVTHKREDDIWEDNSSEREKQLKMLSDELEGLEDALVQKEQTVSDMQSKLDALPEILNRSEEDGAKQRGEELQAEHEHQMKLFQKESEAAIDALEIRINNLKSDYEELLSEKEQAQEKLDRAYEESNQLYLQTVQSTGGIKILSSYEQNNGSRGV